MSLNSWFFDKHNLGKAIVSGEAGITFALNLELTEAFLDFLKIF